MSIQQIINEFQNYTYNKTEIISKYVKDLKNSGALDTNSFAISSVTNAKSLACEAIFAFC